MSKSAFITEIKGKPIAAQQATYAEKDAYGDDIHSTLASKADKSEIPTVPVTDVTVGGNSVVSNGTAAVPAIPTASSLAGTGLTASNNQLTVSVPVPSPSADHADAGKVLTVKTNEDTNTDEVVWDTPASPAVQVDGSTIMNSQQGLKVHPGWGLQEGSGALMARLTEHGGLEFDEEEVDRGIQVATTKGLALHEYGVGIDMTGAAEGKVLTAVDTGDTDSDDNPVYDVEWRDAIPPTSGASDGDVLTYNNGNVDWAPVQGGGGGGGNPYNKVSVTPGERYKNGKTSGYGFELFDQDVSISNNTYSVVSSEVGYTGGTSYPDASGIDILKIKLPANTDFPMAVVEFRVYHFVDAYECGAVNDVEVYVGDTKLTRIYPHPYRKDTLVGTDLDSDEGPVHETAYGQNYWHINGIWDSNKLFSKTAFVATDQGNPIVQVNIFGNCFSLSTNVEANEPAAS